MLKIGIQSRTEDHAGLPPANLVVLVEVSGSMRSADKLEFAVAARGTDAHGYRGEFIGLVDLAQVLATPISRRVPILSRLHWIGYIAAAWMQRWSRVRRATSR